ncbi:MAG: protein phosphatase 2C domain-containing protein [Candidatus Margulisbacteria bacterium]|nr:protein phosphatase 2C domain-containing protein [Candidatus Margulisiibacteriota bacterium]
MANGRQVSISHLLLVALKLQSAVFDRQLARKLIASKATGRLNLDEISRLKQLFFEASPEHRFAVEERVIQQKGVRSRDTILEHLHNLKFVLGQAHMTTSVAEVRDAANLLPGDRISPELAVSSAGSIRGKDGRDFDIKEILLTAQQLALTRDKTALRFHKIVNYIFQQLKLSEYSYQEATLLAKLIFQAAGLSAHYVQGYDYVTSEVTEKAETLERLRGRFDEKSWIEIPVSETELWVVDLFRRRCFLRPKLHEVKRSSEEFRRPAFRLEDGNIYVYQPGFKNQVFRPLTYTNVAAFEVVSELKPEGASDAQTSLLGFDPTIIYARTSQESRHNNQDNFAIATDGERILQVVADGLSGHPRGEKASEIAVWAVLRAFADGASLLQSIQFANFSVWASNVLNPPASGYYSGTTLVASLYDPGRGEMEIAGEGDSRAYRIRVGEVELLTLDDNVVTRMIMAADRSPLGVPLKLGEDRIIVPVTEDDATLEYPGTSYYDYVNYVRDPYLVGMERFLGHEPPIIPTHIARFSAQPGDIYLLATDGLNRLTRDTLLYIVSQNAAGEAWLLVDALIDEVRRVAALNDTANDNITLSA